jgi:pyruvate kinase
VPASSGAVARGSATPHTSGFEGLVLETLAKHGIPSRAEVTDAAMAHRAECVMLNKGPYVVQAVKVLDDILRRMRGHQVKKRSMLRPLRLVSKFQTTRMARRAAGA